MRPYGTGFSSALLAGIWYLLSPIACHLKSGSVRPSHGSSVKVTSPPFEETNQALNVRNRNPLFAAAQK
jgi:hypothetical protein